MSNTLGNDSRGIRRFLRENGYKPDMSTVERVQREVSRTVAQNEAVIRRAKEMGGPATITRDGRDAQAAARAKVQAELAKRAKR